MSADPLSGSHHERVSQIHRRYLNAVYATDYFKEVGERVSSYSRYFDFTIGLGAATTGGAGLGILADPRFAWLCGILTTASIVLTVAKTTFDWPGRLKYATEMVEKYGRISGKYQLLIEDLNYRQVFNAELDDAFKKLREEELDFARDDYPKLKVELQEAIQDAIRKRINYGKWWKPDDSAAADTPAKA